MQAEFAALTLHEAEDYPDGNIILKRVLGPDPNLQKSGRDLPSAAVRAASLQCTQAMGQSAAETKEVKEVSRQGWLRFCCL